MPKGDSLCPLGFHPQFRRPTYCKRCFREYGDHKVTGSSTSVNSQSFDRFTAKALDYGSRDSLASRREDESLTRSRSDLTSSSYSRAERDDATSKGSYTGQRPLSWSAQDLQAAVNNAKEEVKRDPVRASHAYGSRRSATQDLGALDHQTPRERKEQQMSKEAEDRPKSSFSSYLAAKTKSVTKPLSRSTSLNEDSSIGTGSKYASDSKPPRYAGKSTLGVLSENGLEPDEKPRKSIQSLREVKSMDADASYVIQLRPKKKKSSEVKPDSTAADSKVAEAQVSVSATKSTKEDSVRLKKEMEKMDHEIKELRTKNTELELSNKELSAKRTRFGDARRQTDLAKLQQKIDELNTEVSKKDEEIASVRSELNKKSHSTKTAKTIQDLREELETTQKLCQRLSMENEENKREMKQMEEEIEEMQDSFREDQAYEYQDMKKELEMKLKDCRVLGFKLRRADNRAKQLELDKTEVEMKLKELQVGEGDAERAERVQLLENELALAKEVSLNMHDEMEKMKSQLQVAENDKKKLKDKVQDGHKPTGKISRSQIIGSPGGQSLSDQNLSRQLENCLEREQDIKEQLQLFQEESRNLRTKLTRTEEENECLQLQLSKMTAKTKRQRSMERTGSHERSNSVERGSLSRQNSGEKNYIPMKNFDDDLDPTELKVQLELNEQESKVLRRKVENLENDNLRLQKELKDLISSIDSKKNETPSVRDTSYYAKKVRSLEQELSDQRKEIVSLEKEKNQLQTDLDNAKKRPKIARTRSSEISESEDRKKLEKYEKEISMHKKQNEELEASISHMQEELTKHKNTKACNGNSASSSKIKDLEETISKLSTEIDVLKKDNNEMKDSSPYKNRVPKKPKDLTPKTTLVKWVNDLENECAKLNVKLKMNETEKQVLEKMSGAPQDRKGSVDSEMCHLLFTECDTLRTENDSLKTEIEQKINEVQQLKDQIKDSTNKKSQSGAISTQDLENWTPPKLTDLTPKSSMRKMIDDLIRQCALLHNALKDKDKGSSTSSSTDLGDQLQKEKKKNEELTKQMQESKETKTTVRKRLGNSTKEDDTKSYENKILALKKENRELKDRIVELETKETGRSSNAEEIHNLQSEKNKLQRELTNTQQSIDGQEKKLLEKESTIKALEKSERNLHNKLSDADQREEKLVKEQKLLQESETKAKTDREKLRKLQKENDNLHIEYALVKENMNSMEREKDRMNSRHSKEIDSERKTNEELKKQLKSIENEMQELRKKCDRLEKDGSISQLKSTEMQEYKERLKKVETEKSNLSVQIEKLRQESVSQIKDLEKSRKKDVKLLEETQRKYDLLEEEFVIQKAQLTMNNEQSYSDLKNEYEIIEKELKTLRETYNTHKDAWIKEKLEMQVRLTDLENQSKSETNGNGAYSEKQRLLNIIDDKSQQLDALRSQTDIVQDQLSYYRKEADDLRRKVEDLEKLQELAEKRHNSSTSSTNNYQMDIKELKQKLQSQEKTHKTETTKLKMRYDTKLRNLSEEVSATSHHMTKYRKERDTYKEMLDVAQKTIADLKGNSSASYRSSRADNATEAKAHLSEIQDMQATITELEDKLADSRLSQTKVKNELADQKTSFEIQLSEMQTKLNEYEEDRLLSGGGRRLPGLRTRLELNWQKEREEQQRLIQETTTLAKDLRQTLYEVERERDMERLEARRKIEQLRKSISMEHQDSKGKVHELQRDLLELREAHAKLRQINEKLRREKDRTEVEREAMRDKFLGSSREHLNQMTKIEKLLEQMDKVKDLSPLVLGESIDGRQTSLTELSGDPTPKTRAEFTESLKRISRHAEDIRNMMGIGDEYGRIRTPSLRSGGSMESDEEGPSGRSRSVTKGSQRPRTRAQKSQLYRKAQSLDHQIADERNKIWVSTEQGSNSSLESAKTEELRRPKYDFDSSMDRMSTGSQTSELDSEPKKKGFKGMLAKFGRTKSIEDSGTAGSIVGAGLKAIAPGMTGSGNSISSETGTDSTVKGKIRTLFKKSSRSQSSDRDPIMKTPSNVETDSSVTELEQEVRVARAAFLSQASSLDKEL